MIQKSFTRGLSLFMIGVLFIIVPAAASSAAVYGSTSGFLPERHTDTFNIVYSLPGLSGGLFDRNVDYFSSPSTDVIFIGNDDDFSSLTASAIEQAVWDGRMLVISYPATAKFGDSLPVSPGSTVPGNKSLVVTSLNKGIAPEVFSGVNKTFPAPEPVAQRLVGTLKPGAVSLLKFDSGEPALAYRKYGSGFVVEWMLPLPQAYLGTDDADTVTFRTINALLKTVKGSGSPTPTVTTVVTTTVPATPVTTIPTQQVTTHVTGNATIQSSPLGASVFVDGIYQGKTPLKLDGVTTGYHSVRMTMDGYYDFDGSAYVVRDETITVFGSLPAQEKPVIVERTPWPTVAAPSLTTPAPTPAPTQTPSDPIASPAVIAAGIGIVTAGIAAYATIYPHRNKEKKE
jgi:hypothetical protein